MIISVQAEVRQEIVDFALAQLAAGDVCRSKIVQVRVLSTNNHHTVPMSAQQEDNGR